MPLNSIEIVSIGRKSAEGRLGKQAALSGANKLQKTPLRVETHSPCGTLSSESVKLYQGLVARDNNAPEMSWIPHQYCRDCLLSVRIFTLS